MAKEDEKQTTSEEIVKKWMYWSGGLGLIPIPLVDLAVITGVQIKMLADLSKHYSIQFRKNSAKSIVAALLGGIVPTSLAYGTVGSLVKVVPVVGTVLGLFTMPAFAAASTYAVGKVFIQHFESGGTFLDFNPDAVKEYFAEQFEKGLIEAKGGKKKAS